MKKLIEQIRYALGNYKMHHQDNADTGGSLDLVDVVTPDWEDNIKEGEIELDMLAEHIAEYIQPIIPGWEPMTKPIPESSKLVILWNQDRGCAIVINAARAISIVADSMPEHLRFYATAWRWFDYPPEGTRG